MAIYNEDIVDIELTSGTIHRTFLQKSIGMGDAKANRYGVRVLRNGEPENIADATCTGCFVRATGDTVAVTDGTVDAANSIAYVTLPEACYAIEGVFRLGIKLSGSSVTGTVRIVDGVVNNIDTGSYVDPGTVMPTIQDLIEEIEDTVATIPADYSDLWKTFESTYSTSNTYNVGDYTTYDGKLYRCVVKIATGETWTATHWTPVDVGSELVELKKAITNITGNDVSYGWIDNKWIDTSGTVDVTSYDTHSGYSCCVIPCTAGDQFTITGKGSTNSHKLWTFIDSNGTKLKSASSNATATSELLTAPNNAIYLVVNADMTKERWLYKNKLLINAVSELPTIDDLQDYMTDGVLEAGEYLLAVKVDKGNIQPMIINFDAKYTQSNGTNKVPTISTECRTDYPGTRIFFSHTYEFASKEEYAHQSWRCPNGFEVGALVIRITVPENTTLDVKRFGCEFSEAVRQGTGNIIFHAHRGFDKLLPPGSYNAMISAAQLGFQSCIEIPKFTSDNVPVCFHNDGGSNSKLSDVFTMPDGSAVSELTDSSTISDFTLAKLKEWSIGYSKNAAYADEKILTMDDFLRICAMTGMRPIFSIHPAPSVSQWAQLKALTDKYGLTKQLSVKTGDTAVWKNVIDTFGDGNIFSIINIVGASTTYDILSKISTGRTTSGAATTRIDAEFFYEGLTSSTYGTAQLAMLAAAHNAGYVCSVVLDNGTKGAEIKEFMDLGVTEFTNARHCSIGLNW